jgi:cytoskeletal protein RodZ
MTKKLNRVVVIATALLGLAASLSARQAAEPEPKSGDPSASSQSSSNQSSSNQPSSNQPSPATTPKDSNEGRRYSGTYTFLKEGEYVQITVEDAGQVTGFISRFDNAGSQSGNETGAFVDQFFKSGKLESGKLTFTTKPLHDEWFEFTGTVGRGDGKDPGDEAYYVLKGTLTENTTGSDRDKKATSHAQQVTLKMFPEAESAPKN